MNFQQGISVCQSVRGQFSRLFYGVPTSFSFTSDGRSVIFLSSTRGEGNALYSVRLGEAEDGDWERLCRSIVGGGTRLLSRSEQLLRERMRATGHGITKYQYLRAEDQLLVVDGPTCSIIQRDTEEMVCVFPDLPGAIDHKLCPSCPTLLACVFEGDLWLLDASTGQKHQLTHTAGTRKQTKITAGQPSFIIQEEFDRYTGYWWRDESANGVHCIVYEEVDESRVNEVYTFNPSTQTVDNYLYPKAGCHNASSTLKLLEFQFIDNGELQLKSHSLPWTLSECFPAFEYLLRVGWMPGGKEFWTLLLDRAQTHMQLVVFSREVFTGSHDRPYVLWEEESDHWVEVTDILEFHPTQHLKFVVTSEASGYRHLYLVEATRPPTAAAQLSSGQLPQATCITRQLTTGDWIVFGSNVWVDWEKQLVYFQANAATPLEKHLYSVSLSTDSPCHTPTQLTSLGYSHEVTLDLASQQFVTVHSSTCCPPSAVVYSLSLSSTQTRLWRPNDLPSTYTPPTHFSFTCTTGEKLHGLVYSPAMRQAGRLYPTAVYCYGGPQIQMVANEMSRLLPRLLAWVQAGFAVIVIDNRGSSNRGVLFTAYVRGQMGCVEVADQVTGIHEAAKLTGYVDLSRVAIIGWSYGGYLAIMALAKRPDIFKVAIAGAPVTEWLEYDTGYTERYLGLPQHNNKAYERSSVLHHVHSLPLDSNRLLLLHGLSDENVFFTQTSLLLDRLLTAGKPYQLQVYPQERHGLRSIQAVLHCDATVLFFLISQLKS